MGGNIFSMTTRIKKDSVQPTYESIVKSLGLSDCKLLGSSGKKETSGDLDIAVSEIGNESIITIKSVIEEVYGTCEKQGKMLSFPCPIYGSEGYVQVDLMFGSVDWLELYYYYDESSKLKGVHRNIAISVLCRYVDSKVINSTLSTNNKPLSYERYKWSNTQGFVRVRREAVMTKTGKHAKKEKETLIGDPLYKSSEISRVLFGNIDNADKYLRSAESIIEYIEEYMDDADEILDSIAIEFSNPRIHAEELEYPICIKQRLREILSGSFIGNVGKKTVEKVQSD